MVIGILLSHYFPISLFHASVITIVLFCALAIAYIISKPLYKKNIWFGCIAFLTMISLGILIANIHDHRNYKSHYTHLKSFYNDSTSYMTLRITDPLKSNIYNDKYVVEVLKIDSIKTSGLALLNIKIDSVSKPLQVDDLFIINAKFYPLLNPLNPNQFNYKAFLENKNIYSKLFTDYQSLYIVSHSKQTIFGFADAIRSKINQKLKNYTFTTNQLAIINALLLGQRKEISDEIYDDYKKAGAIHILAVSGLHVGIILLFLNLLFKPIELVKHGHIYKIVLIIICLWSFAIIAGLSASVSRAATMFTFVAVGMNYKRPLNTLNTLACSAFILLLIRPSFVFDVGFQLSYFAVIGIVTFYPFFYRLFKPKYWVVDKLWQALVVSVVAQFGILPISLFYFHQFPGLFLLSNVIVIPVLGIILGYGLIVIGMALLNILPDFIASIYGNIISWMNDFFKWIAQQEAFYFKDISFNLIEVFVSYLFIIAFYQFYKIKSFKHVVYVLLAIILFQNIQIFTKYQEQSKNRFVIFQKNRQSLIGIQEGKSLLLNHNIPNFNKTSDYVISNFVTENNISTIIEDSMKSLYKINKEYILTIDSLGVYKVRRLKPDIILLRNSPKINLIRVIDSLKPKRIIADGSNYKSYTNRWEATCQKLKVSFHSTYKKGAFVINYNSN
ncbi:competence protein [Flavobacteriaceae bacterium LYZ1037]|nr:competence protein [Flavobacteriaceae bacterium LYZ1037]